MEPNISVVIPWRPQPSRMYAFNMVRRWYEINLPQAKIMTVDDGRQPFCLSGSRNLGVQQAQNEGADVVILSDADTIPQISPLMFAIDWAMKGDRVILPYTEYRSLQKLGTDKHIKGMPLEDCPAFVVDGACSGIYVFQPQVWWAHYGQDERFRGWGFEDAAWLAAHTTLLGKEPKRLEGHVYAFTHTSAIKQGPDYDRNAQLCYKYLNAEGNYEAMKELASQGLFLDDRMV